jgi:hypothetical protein
MQQSRKLFAAVALLLAFMASLSGGAARKESVTIDEVAHIGAGVSYLQKLDMRLNIEHPPLAKVLAAIRWWRAGCTPSTRIFPGPSAAKALMNFWASGFSATGSSCAGTIPIPLSCGPDYQCF